VSNRILGLFVKVGKKNMWMFQVYAPVNDTTKGEKETFCMVINKQNIRS
jgi:hypothetical protein